MSRKKFPTNPPHPERNCWGCDLYCAADQMMCGNGSERSQHPAELFGADWAEWAEDHDAQNHNAPVAPAPVSVHKSKTAPDGGGAET